MKIQSFLCPDMVTFYKLLSYLLYKLMGFPGGARGKEPACQCRRHKRHGFNPWVRKFPWKLQYPCLENPLGRRFWWTTVHRVAKSPTRLKQHSTHTHILTQKSHSQVFTQEKLKYVSIKRLIKSTFISVLFTIAQIGTSLNPHQQEKYIHCVISIQLTTTQQ